MRAMSSGAVRARWASLAMVKEATSREPAACAKSASAFSRSASGAAETLFQSGAGRTGSPFASSVTQPCCWPPTAMARTIISGVTQAWMAATSAAHQSRGSWMSAPVWEARPSATTCPVARSSATTLTDCVLESTPSATSRIVVMAASRMARACPWPASSPASAMAPLSGDRAQDSSRPISQTGTSASSASALAIRKVSRTTSTVSGITSS